MEQLQWRERLRCRVKRGFQLHLNVETSKLSLTMQVMSSATKEGVRTPGRRERRKEVYSDPEVNQYSKQRAREGDFKGFVQAGHVPTVCSLGHTRVVLLPQHFVRITVRIFY